MSCLESMCKIVINNRDKKYYYQKMTDFVLDLTISDTLDKDVSDIHRSYAELITSKANLGMFVPCYNGNVVKFIEYEKFKGSDLDYNNYCESYFKAEDEVLFKGFKIENNRLCYSDFYILFDINEINNFTIESIMCVIPDLDHPELTETFIKKIGLKY